MIASIRALLIRERYIARLTATLREQAESVHRLEIKLRQLQESHDYLEGAVESLRARWKGEKGGRPPKSAQGALPLESIAVGDKAALRRHFGLKQ